MTCWGGGKAGKYTLKNRSGCVVRKFEGVGTTHLYGASEPGEDRRLALLTEQVHLALREFRAKDLRVASDKLWGKMFRYECAQR